jgi:hypothetical protein
MLYQEKSGNPGMKTAERGTTVIRQPGPSQAGWPDEFMEKSPKM